MSKPPSRPVLRACATTHVTSVALPVVALEVASIGIGYRPDSSGLSKRSEVP